MSASFHPISPILLGATALYLFSSNGVLADSPIHQTMTDKRAALILSLPEQRYESEPRTFPSTSKLSSEHEKNLIMSTLKSRKPPVGVACNMDLNQPASTTDMPLTSRISGNCEFDYRY